MRGKSDASVKSVSSCSFKSTFISIYNWNRASEANCADLSTVSCTLEAFEPEILKVFCASVFDIGLKRGLADLGAARRAASSALSFVIDENGFALFASLDSLLFASTT